MTEESNRQGSAGRILSKRPALPSGRQEWVEFLFRFQSLFGLIVVFLAAIAFSPRRDGEILFLSLVNLTNILRSVSEIGIIAIGMTFVILVGGIDLSVGSILGLAATGSAVLMVEDNFGVLPAVLLVLLIGMAFGAVQGFVSTRFAVQAFIVTLAGLQIGRGLARIWSGGQGVAISYGEGKGQAPESFSILSERVFNGLVPVPALIFFIVGAIAVFVLNKTTFSRHVYAIGGNERAARISGVPVMRVKITVFAISGMLAALAGIIHAGQLSQGSPNDGIAYELDAIAAVVVGGTSLMGGVGSVVGTIGGAIMLGVLNNILALNSIDINTQYLIKGLVIVAAAALLSLRSGDR